MIDRIKNKILAKEQLKAGRWGIAIAATLLLMLIENAYIFTYTFFNVLSTTILEEIDNMSAGGLLAILFATPIGMVLNLAGAAAYSIAAYSIQNGFLRMTQTKDDIPLSAFFKGFKQIFRSLGVILWKGLWILLWSMLFYIPGLIKIYEYMMMDFVALENEKLNARESMNISKIITKGHKFDLFVLDLSFMGWYLLTIFTFGIGFLWLMPYVTVTKANVYNDLMDEAIREGKIPPEYLAKLSRKPAETVIALGYQEKLEAPVAASETARENDETNNEKAENTEEKSETHKEDINTESTEDTEQKEEENSDKPDNN